MRVVFAGTPDFAAASLEALIAAGHEIPAVYTQPDRPAGRGRSTRPGPVKQLALDHGLAVEQPGSLKNTEVQQKLTDYRPDVMVVAAYGLLLPAEVLRIPAYGCLNVHASLLPRWRGAAPIQRALAAGDSETGITIMQMDEGLDTGDMLLKLSTPISDDDTGGSLHDRLAGLGGEAIVEALEKLAAGNLTPEPQDNHLATYASKLDKSETWIDWEQGADSIARRIRAFNPWPVCTTRDGETTLRLLEAESVTHGEPVDPPGTVLSREASGAQVQCGEGAINITRIQLPGGKPQSIQDLINGGRPVLEPGRRLGS